MVRIVLTLALAAYNNVANLWPPFNRAAYVPANILATAAVILVAVGPLELSGAELGITSSSAADLALGIAIGAVIGGPLLLAARAGVATRLMADRRVTGLQGGALAYQTLVRVPLGTALLEEVAFRGALFAAWSSYGDVTGAIVSSVVFGLWHVTPATIMVRANSPGATRRDLLGRVAGTVVLTTAIGLALVWLRLETGSLAAPFAVHAVVNSVATWAGVLAGRLLARNSPL